MPTYAFDLPTAEDVRIESRLRPEQVDVDLRNDAQLEADVDARISKKAVFVSGKLARAAAPYAWPFSEDAMKVAYPSYTTEQITAESEYQRAMAKQIVELYALASLFRSARKYADAKEHEDKAKELMLELTGGLDFVKTQQPDNSVGTGVSVWTVGVGNAITGDEYSQSI